MAFASYIGGSLSTLLQRQSAVAADETGTFPLHPATLDFKATAQKWTILIVLNFGAYRQMLSIYPPSSLINIRKFTLSSLSLPSVPLPPFQIFD
jgi:hypothetical protein